MRPSEDRYVLEMGQFDHLFGPPGDNWPPYELTVVPYQSEWPLIFDEWSETLYTNLGPWIRDLHHIGSTSVPQLAAKPIVDLLLLTDTPQDAGRLQTLAGLGFVHRRAMLTDELVFLATKGHAVHLHVVRPGAAHVEEVLATRDYLRAHPHVRDAYGRLKSTLASASGDLMAYINGKDAFVKQVRNDALQWRHTRKTLAPAGAASG